jgi:hypothetical protein
MLERDSEGMRRRIKITNEREAEMIIEELGDLVEKGQELSDKQKCDYEFAKMFLNDIKRRKGSKTHEHRR